MTEEAADPIPYYPVVDPAAELHERNVQQELNDQHRILMQQAKGIFAAVKGRRGARNEDYWQEVFAKAKIDYDSGKFLIERLGASRQLDLPLVATLTQIRQELLDGIDTPTAADKMLADSAILAFRNLLRVQGWIGSLSLSVERELFGQLALDAVLGQSEATAVQQTVERLEMTFYPLLDRAQRMMIRAFDRLAVRKSGNTSTVSIGRAGQVNVGGEVRNEMKDRHASNSA